LAATSNRIIYLDGFAGPGIYEDGKEGSPLIALRTAIDHIHQPRFKAEIKFAFIENDLERASMLRRDNRTAPCRIIFIAVRTLCDVYLTFSIYIHHTDIPAPVSIRLKDNSGSTGRPCGISIFCRIVREGALIISINIHHIDFFIPISI
jgi:hypothetical protein